jgi:aminoglycoside phosphotransferase (APT) family kinase protein
MLCSIESLATPCRSRVVHEDQVPIDAEIAAALIRDQFLEYRDQPIVALRGMGTDNAIFRIGNGLAARFPLRAMDPVECAAGLRAEAAAMTAFARHAPVATPRPISIGRPGPLYPMPWAVQTWIEGAVATPDGLADSTAFARDIVTLIGKLRAADTGGGRFDGQGRGGALPDHDAWMETCFQNSAGLLDVPRLRALWVRLRGLPPAGPDVMCHRDLIPANLLVDGARLSGVLDAGRFGPADPALDLVAAWHLFDRPRRDILRKALGAGEVEWKRGAGWAFQQAMGLVWYYEKSNSGMSALGRSTLDRLLDDPDL